VIIVIVIKIKNISDVNNKLFHENHKLRDEHKIFQKNVEFFRKEKSLKLETLKKKEEKIDYYMSNAISEIENHLKEKSQAFPWLAGMIADYLTLAENRYIIELKNSFSVAKHDKAIRITDLKLEKKQLLQEIKVLKYEISNIKVLFPDIVDYFEFDGFSKELTFEKEFIDFLSKEEYQKLSEQEKNIKALEYYRKKQKTKWEIGRDYESSVGYYFETKGYEVEYFGIEKKYNDLGRDLIVKNKDEIFIIQCKYWSSKKIIHENHINQLYGTFVKYVLENKNEQRIMKGLFITKTKLSETAHEFAEALGVICYENFEMIDFPIIKCKNNYNDNREETKIYHLPMDQQYDKTVIRKEKGDFFAFSVKEAEDSGFRRAYKWRNS